MTTTARRARPSVTGALLTLLTWVIVLLFFFPVFWMFLTGFKTEAQAATDPPTLFFKPTLTNFSDALSNGVSYFEHSFIIVGCSTALVLLVGLPASYALSIAPVHGWKDSLFFFISTKMLPAAGSIVALYVIARNLHVLDHLILLIVLYTAMNLPIAVWMLRSFLLEIPVEIVEAARVDGASLQRLLRSVILPVISPGVAATALICFIFGWNEFFLAVNLTTTDAATVPIYLVSFQTGEGQFWARLCAAATLACLPVLIAGWAAQDKLVRGLSMGAVK
jgi:sorbitol/mannitol transport system permease protein